MKRLTLCCLMLLIVPGCASRGPNRLEKDRAGYGQAIGDSWKAQTLRNIVRLRYLDWPTFLSVEHLATGYAWNVNAAATTQVRTPFLGDSDQLQLGGGASFQERPTVVYRPLSGANFVRSLLAPVPPSIVLALVQAGWEADRLVQTLFHSVNGFKNLNSGTEVAYRPAPEFLRFSRLMRVLQSENAISSEVEMHTPGGAAQAAGTKGQARVIGDSKLSFQLDEMSNETREEFELMRRELNLDTDTDTYRVTWGLRRENDQTIAVQTRSMIGLMGALAFAVDIPQEDLDDGSAPYFEPVPDIPNEGARRLMRVRSGLEMPDNAYVATLYDGHWYWIDKADSNSKRTFAYLSMLLTVTEGGEGGGAPLVLSVN